MHVNQEINWRRRRHFDCLATFWCNAFSHHWAFSLSWKHLRMNSTLL